MKKQTGNQKGLAPLLIIIAVIVVVIVIAVFLSTQKGGLPAPERTGTQQTTQSVPAIQNISDFNAVASELDNTDLNELDKELNRLDTDTSAF